MTRSSCAAVAAAFVDTILFCFNLFVRGKCKVDDIFYYRMAYAARVN